MFTSHKVIFCSSDFIFPKLSLHLTNLFWFVFNKNKRLLWLFISQFRLFSQSCKFISCRFKFISHKSELIACNGFFQNFFQNCKLQKFGVYILQYWLHRIKKTIFNCDFLSDNYDFFSIFFFIVHSSELICHNSEIWIIWDINSINFFICLFCGINRLPYKWYYVKGAQMAFYLWCILFHNFIEKRKINSE